MVSVLALALARSVRGNAEDTRTQYPDWLAHAYIGFDVGYINYPFSSFQLEPGNQVESVHVPHAAARVALFGYRFGDYVSAQINYIRPVEWVRYRNVNGGALSNAPVFTNVATLSGRLSVPLKDPWFVTGELGLGIITRAGFAIDDVPVVKDANYATVVLGAGLGYHINRTWDLGARVTYSPANNEAKQPQTVLLSGGFTFNVRPRPEETVQADLQSGHVFPVNVIQVGYATDTLGLGVNHFVSGTIPIFYSGRAVVGRGLTLHYQRNVFHTRRVFSFSCGASVSYWRSAEERQTFYTAALYPVFRFTPLRFGSADVYFNYSIAGPASISRVSIDGVATGRHFTFQDFLGIGAYMGKKRNVNAEVRVGHYSNGNLFPQNFGVQVPLTFNLGYAF